MSFHIQNQTPTVSDPALHGWPLAIAIATVFSACAVVVYIIQLIVTTRQFKRQLLENQRQFKILNQGYVIMEWLVYPISSLSEAGFKGIKIIAKITNSGNLPVKIRVEAFRIDIIAPPVHAQIAEQQLTTSLYPKQISELILLPEYILPNNMVVNLDQLINLNIRASVILHYTDFDNEGVKRVNREFLISGNGNQLIPIITSNNDTI